MDIDEALEEVIQIYKELAEVLSTVTDEASARAAVDDVTRISARFEELDQRMGNFTEAEMTSAIIRLGVTDFTQGLNEQMIRISSNPEIFGLLAEAFGDLN